MMEAGQKKYLLWLKILALVLVITTPFMVAATKLVGGFFNVRVVQKLIETRKLIELPISCHNLFFEWQFQKPEANFIGIKSLSIASTQIRSSDFFDFRNLSSEIFFGLLLFAYSGILFALGEASVNQFFDSVYSWTRPPNGLVFLRF
jgi:hypothetical protein